jgi:hypothetical protein
MTETLKLKRFDMRMIKSDNTVLLLGRRNTGKSFLVRDLLSHHTDVPTGVVISPTECANRFYGNIFPPLFIHNAYTKEIVENVVKRQKIVTKKAQDHPGVDPRCIFIMDDCLYDTKWQRDENVRYIFTNGRHINILFLLTSQYPLGIPPTMRSNIDFVFILRDNMVRNRRIIYENYCGMLPTFEAFCNVLDQTTQDYECLVVHNSTRSNDITDQIYYYRASDPPPFQIGSRELWNVNNANLDREGSDDDEPYNPSAVKTRRILVKKV